MSCGHFTSTMSIVAILLYVMLSMQIICADTRISSGSDLQDLKSYCYPRELSRPDMTYKQLEPLYMSGYLDNLSTQDVTKLHISILPSPNDIFERINVDQLYKLQNLSELWIVQNTKLQRNRLAFAYDNTTFPINVREFHFHAFYNGDEGDLIRIVQNMPHLQLLDFSGLHYHKANFSAIMLALQNKPLKVLILNDFQMLTSVAILHVHLGTLLDPVNTSGLLCLELCGNNLMSVSGNVSDILPNIRIFNVSRNLLNSDNAFITFVLELLWHPILEIINISHQGLHMPLVEHRRSLHQLAKRDTKVFSQDPFTHDRCFKSIAQAIFLNNRSALCERLDCASISCSLIPVSIQLSSLLDFACSPPIKIPFGRNLKELIFDDMNLMPRQRHFGLQDKFKVCFSSNDLQKISLAQNSELIQFRLVMQLIQKLEILGLKTVSYIDLSFNQNNITIPMNNFGNFVKLKTLKLQGNTITLVKLNSTSLCSFYTKLHFLDISSGDIKQIPEGYFSHCDSLFDLNLQNNYLDESDLSRHLQDFIHIEKVNLRHNEIHHFPQDVRDLLTKKANTKVTLDFTGNPFTCDCSDDSVETIRFLQEIQDTAQLSLEAKDSYECFQTYFGGGGYQFIKTINLEDVNSLCYPRHTNLVLITVTGISLLVAVCCCTALVWKYRFYLFTSYYRMKLWCTSTVKATFKYDVFVAYCSEDRFWVHDVLMKTLEDKYNFRLCIHYRDFILGEDIDDEIVKHMSQSRVHIVVISENSVKKPWPTFELKRAYTEHINKHKDLIVIKFGDITSNSLPGLVHQILDAKVYLKWPEAKDGVRTKKQTMRQELFWARLSSRLYGSNYPCYLRTWCWNKLVKGGNINYILDDTIELLED